jgi:hypothetical protein
MSDKYLTKASSQYQSEWDSYDNRSADQILAALAVAGIAIAAGIAGRYNSWVADALQVVLLISFAGLIVVTYRYFGAFRCPRCRKTFAAPRHRNVWEGDVCDHCELPRYYGSKKYIDIVGVEQARAYAENLARWRG